jgi:aspartate-semialdehyde dehydrogenase
LDADSFDGAAIVFLAGNAASSRQAAELAQNRDPAPVLIDLTYALEDRADARLRAPVVETAPVPSAGTHVIAHPAAIALALFLTRLRRVSEPVRSIAHVFEPASERGQQGIDELQQLTVCLLCFKPLKKDVYDAQLSFNLLPRLGEDAPLPLEEIEDRVERHLASLLSQSPGAVMPSVRLVQAPVFHGYSISVWSEFGNRPDIRQLLEALASAQVEIRASSEETPTNVGAANQSGITVGAVSADRNHPQACWFWIVADNLRLAAEEAVAVARQLAESA